MNDLHHRKDSRTRPELAELACKLHSLGAGIPARDRIALEKAAEQYRRASTVPKATALTAGDTIGDIQIVALVERSEHGRRHLVMCLRCHESWVMKGAKLRRMWIWRGVTCCRTCREAER